MSDRAHKFLAFRARSKVQKALRISALDVVADFEADDLAEQEIDALHQALTRNAAADANYDYSDATDLVLVELVAARPAARFAYLES